MIHFEQSSDLNIVLCTQIAESKELTEGALIRVGEYMVNQVQGLQ